MADSSRDPRRGPWRTDPTKADTFTTGEDILDRAREVAHDITEQCERLTGGTQVDLRPLPLDPARRRD